jgi:alanine dehydrogenase
MIARMKKGAVVVDVSVDQGGCIETTHPTTHSDPTYVVDGVLHYGVANMPGAVPNTSTYALTNATHRYAMAIADKGWRQAVLDDPSLARGVNILDGKVTNTAVAEAHDMECVPLETLIGE